MKRNLLTIFTTIYLLLCSAILVCGQTGIKQSAMPVVASLSGNTFVQVLVTNYNGLGYNTNFTIKLDDLTRNQYVTRVINVAASPWNVDPTGLTDSTIGLQAAINYATDQARASGVSGKGSPIVQLPSGWIKITNQITIPPLNALYVDGQTANPNHIVVKGMGTGATLLDATGIPDGTFAIKAMNDPTSPNAGKAYYHLQMEDFTLVGPNIQVNDYGTNMIPYLTFAITTSNHTVGIGVGGSGQGTHEAGVELTQPVHFAKFSNLDVWGFNVNFGLTNCTETVFDRCRFYAGGKGDLIADNCDQTRVRDSSLGVQIWTKSGVTNQVDFIGSLAVIGGAGATIDNTEISGSPRLVYLDSGLENFTGCNFESCLGPDMLWLTNYPFVSVQNCLFNFWSSTTNNALFHGWNGGLDFLSVGSGNSGVGARTFIQTDYQFDNYFNPPLFFGQFFTADWGIVNYTRQNVYASVTNVYHVSRPNADQWGFDNHIMTPLYSPGLTNIGTTYFASTNRQGMLFDSSPDLSGALIYAIGFVNGNQMLELGGSVPDQLPEIRLVGPSWTNYPGSIQIIAGNNDVFLESAGILSFEASSNKVFSVMPFETHAGTSNNFGYASSKLGFSSYTNNAVAVNSFTFPNTTVLWTNTFGINIALYIDQTGVTGTAINKNGTKIGNVLVGSMSTLFLKPGDYFSETYTVGSPVGTWEPQ